MAENIDLLAMTTGIVANYVTRNHLAPDEIPALIAATHAALAQVDQDPAEPEEPVAKPSAAEVRKSVSDNGIRSFLDGRLYQSLKRHLNRNGITPDEYRTRYGLAATYPMVSPAYSAKRSELAKAIGLGQGGRQPKKSTAERAPRKPARTKS